MNIWDQSGGFAAVVYIWAVRKSPSGKLSTRRCNFGIRLLSGSLSEYWRATRMWWQNIERKVPQMLDRPVYLFPAIPTACQIC
jgi:hypothetical protein